jgi:hypothetical protein
MKSVPRRNQGFGYTCDHAPVWVLRYEDPRPRLVRNRAMVARRDRT